MRTLLALALFSLPVAAQTVYSWEDAEGVHFTDDLSQVPKDARNLEAAQHARVARPAPAQTTTAAVASPATAAPAAPASGLDEREWRGRFVTAHRRISTLQQELRALEASLPPRTECIAPPLVPGGAVMVNGYGQPVTVTTGAQVVTQNGVRTLVNGPVVAPGTRCRVNELHDRLKVQIAEENVKLKDAQLDLEQLERDASYAGVPREWRRGW